MRALAGVMDKAGRTAATLSGAPDWLTDPYCYDQALKAAQRVLEALRPPGEVRQPTFDKAQVVEAVPGLIARMLDSIGTGIAETALATGQVGVLNKEPGK
jgi:hypothetical protein